MHVQLVPLFRIVSIPCPTLTVLWHLPTLRPPQTSLGELLLGRKLPPLPQPTLPPLPWGRVGWRRRARLQMRLGVQWATDSLLAALLPPNSSQNQEFSAFIDLLTDHLRVCLVPGPMSGTWGCNDESDPVFALNKPAGKLGKQTSKHLQYREPRVLLGDVQNAVGAQMRGPHLAGPAGFQAREDMSGIVEGVQEEVMPDWSLEDGNTLLAFPLSLAHRSLGSSSH